MIVVTKRPITIYQGQESRWNAGYNPIVYSLEATSVIDLVKYNILLEVYEFGSDKLLGVQKIKPFLKKLPGQTTYSGIINFDVSAIVNSFLQKEFNYTGTTVNQKDPGSYIRFYIKYYERSYNEILTTNSDGANPVFAVAAANQIGYKHGSNLAEYVPYASDITPKAKYLSRFVEPTYYVGYPFFLSFIYSENIAGISMKKQEEELDINRNIVATTEQSLDPSQIRSVNSLKLRENYTPLTQYVRLAAQTGVAITDTYVDLGYVDLGYTE